MICQQEEQDRADEKTLTQDVIVARQLDFSRTACRGCTCDPHAYPCIDSFAGFIPDRRRRTAWHVVTVLQIGATRQQAADVPQALRNILVESVLCEFHMDLTVVPQASEKISGVPPYGVEAERG